MMKSIRENNNIFTIKVLLHPELTPWWSFLFAEGAHHKKPHSPTHPRCWGKIYCMKMYWTPAKILLLADADEYSFVNTELQTHLTNPIMHLFHIPCTTL